MSLSCYLKSQSHEYKGNSPLENLLANSKGFHKYNEVLLESDEDEISIHVNPKKNLFDKNKSLRSTVEYKKRGSNTDYKNLLNEGDDEE